MDERKNTKKDYKSGEAISFSNVINRKFKIKMDEKTLEMILNFIFKKSALRTRKALKNIKLLFDSIDDSIYEDKFRSMNLIWLIRKSTELWLTPDTDSTDIVEISLKDDLEWDDTKAELYKNIDTSELSYEEGRRLINLIDDRLRFGYVGSELDTFQNIVRKIDLDDYKTYHAIDNDLYQFSMSVVNAKRNTNSLESDQTFSLKSGEMEAVVTDAVTRLKNRNDWFITGLSRLNSILGGAFFAKKLYVFLALPAGGKSFMLLKCATDIKKYNTEIKSKNPDKRPAILMLTLENDIDETIERLFSLAGDLGDIRNYTPQQVIKHLKGEGQLNLVRDNDMDIIIKYYPNRSIDTNDLYSIIEDISDGGEEVKVLIIDYMKRLKAAEKGKDEKEELKNISNELKTLAKIENICVITAQQLNRAASATVDAARRANRNDATNLIGRENVGSSWEIIENADWTCVLNQETKHTVDADHGKKIVKDDKFMGFKMVKRRYKSFESDESLRRLDIFYQPYETAEGLRLIDDVGLDKPVSLLSLHDENERPDFTNGRSITERPHDNTPMYDNAEDTANRYEIGNKGASPDEEFESFSTEDQGAQF